MDSFVQPVLYRDSQLIGKAHITTVNKNNSVGELVPGFTLGTPRPGDQAILESTNKM